MLVSELFLPNSNEWNRENIKAMFPGLEHTITDLKPSIMGAKDKVVWLSHASSRYSAKSGYQTAKKISTPPEIHYPSEIPFNWNSRIWNINTSQKFKLFLWKTMRGALPIGDQLAFRGIMAQSQCVRCGKPKSINHLFFHCEFAQKVWKLALFKNTINSVSIPNIQAGIDQS